MAVSNDRGKQVCFARRRWYFENYCWQGCESYQFFIFFY